MITVNIHKKSLLNVQFLEYTIYTYILVHIRTALFIKFDFCVFTVIIVIFFQTHCKPPTYKNYNEITLLFF
jgi:hypothetical protein